ncbi:MAG: 1-phosphofructokinase [Peptostreptococcaceae bacterium]
MIYTLTLNPSIDYIVELDNFVEGSVNRTKNEKAYPGGKGINVSSILRALEFDSIALGFVSGFTGEYVKQILTEKNINHNFIEVNEGFTRINVKIKSSDETEVNGSGPNISENQIQNILDQVKSLKKYDILVIAGSMPSSVRSDIYEDIMKIAKEKEILVVADTTKKLLTDLLKHNPFLIKPNIHELEEIFETKINSDEEIITFAKQLQTMGAKNVLVSLGKDGAILVTDENQILKSNVAKGTVKNSVGAGDSMVGGFIAGYIKNKDYKDALKLGATCGCATTFSYDIATKEFIDSLIDEINVENI